MQMAFFRPRYELKYLVSPATAFAIAGKLTGRCHLDANGSDGYYINESLYFDSPNFDFFFHKIEGVKLRKKVRIRRYGHQGPWEKVFVEIKKRNGQYIEKARFAMDPHLLPSLFAPSQRDACRQNLNPLECQVYNEVLSLAQLFHLRPILFIRYLRRSFWAEGDERLRITFDSELGYDTVSHDCRSPLGNINYIFGGDQIILEIKANGNVPFWVLELIQEHECRMIRFSKYCLGVQAACGLGGSGFSYAKEQAALFFTG